jgi:DNA-binding IclR family transcriptional regulator
LVTPAPDAAPEDLPPSSASGIQVIARAADILRAIARQPGGMSQAELAETLGLARTTVHRIVGALEYEGLIRQTRTGSRYRLGAEIARMAAAVNRDSLAIMHTGLAELSRTLGETVDLSVLDGPNVRFLDQVVAANRLQAVSAVGELFPLHACAPGKAILATLAAGGRAELIPTRLPSLTANTLTTVAALRRELRLINQDDVAYDREEHTEGICAVAAVIDPDADDPMAISVPMPAQRFYGREPELREAVLSARDELRKGLGDDD